MRLLVIAAAFALCVGPTSVDPTFPPSQELRWTSRSGVQQTPPNVLLITLDTVRADRIGAYGYKGASTPNLDRLAAEGVRFADATSASPLTAPAHTAGRRTASEGTGCRHTRTRVRECAIECTGKKECEGLQRKRQECGCAQYARRKGDALQERGECRR